VRENQTIILEPNQQKAISIVELRLLRYLPAQHIDLLA
jgi:hypothetical protein